MSTAASPSFHRRSLPCPPAVAFSSEEGRELFREAMCQGYMEGYYLLAEQFRTQDEPAFCGLTSLVMVLNALAMDPKRQWKGVWRWYHEQMLGCCRDLEEVKVSGITLNEFECLARCHGLMAAAKQPEIQGSSVEVPLPERADGYSGNTRFRPTAASLDQFRSDVKITTSTPDAPILVVSYSRKQFLQTGDGHYSPVAGYHSTSDRCLILDTARFKYPPHWVSVVDLYESMKHCDSETQQPRGWFMLVRDPAQEMSSIFPLTHLKISSLTAAELLNFSEFCCAGTICDEVRAEMEANQDQQQGLEEQQKVEVAGMDISCHGRCRLESEADHTLSMAPRVNITVLRFLSCMPSGVKDWAEQQSAEIARNLEAVADNGAKTDIHLRLAAAIRSAAVFPIVVHVLPQADFGDVSSRSDGFHVAISFLLLVFLTDGFLRTRIQDQSLREALQEIVRFDATQHIELSHEVCAARGQLRSLQDYLVTMYPAVQKDKAPIASEASCCKQSRKE